MALDETPARPAQTRPARSELATALDASAAGWVSYAVVAVVSGSLLFYMGRGLTYFWDDWGVVLDHRPVLDELLEPHNGHVVFFLMALYRPLLHLFGLGDYSGFRAIVVALHLCISTLIYIFARRRIGPLAALAPAAVVLFLGTGGEDLFWAFQIGFLGSIASGLGALMLVERRSLPSRLGACLLLVLSAGFSEIGIAFVVAALFLLLTERERWRDLWVAGIPVVAYGLWYIAFDSGSGARPTLTNAVHAPGYIALEIAAAIGIYGVDATLYRIDPATGHYLYRPTMEIAAGACLGIALALVLVYFLVKRLLSSRGRGFGHNRLLWALALAGAAFWIPVALIRANEASPGSSRYVYVGGIFVTLIALELIGPREVGSKTIAFLALGTIAIVGGNVRTLYDFRDFFMNSTRYTRAETGALEIARSTVPGEFAVYDPTPHVPLIVASDYFHATGRFGSPAYSPAQIAAAPEPVRQAADRVLVAALPLRIQQPGKSLATSTCRVFSPAEPSSASMKLEPGRTVLVEAGSAPASVSVRRFAQTGGAGIGNLPARGLALVSAPRDGASRSWQLIVSSPRSVSLCSAT
jgi:hypothetical protein